MPHPAPHRPPVAHRLLCLLLLFAPACRPSSADDNPASAEAPPESLWQREEGEDWPAFLGPRADGVSAERGLQVDQWTDRGPKLLWHLPLGEGYGACTVSRGRVFQFDRVGDNNRLRCLQAETGKPLWEFRYPTDYVDHYGYDGGPRCSPLVDGPRVYTYDANGELYCLDAETGKVRWKFDLNERFGVIQNFFGVGSNPVVHGDLLIVMVGGSPKDDQYLPASQLDRARGDGSAIVGLDKRTGKVRYQFGDELASYASLKLATIDDQPWGLAFARGGLVGFDPVQGRQRFHFPWRARILESVNASTPVVHGNEVLISETYGPGSALVRLDDGEVEVVWKDEDKGRDKSLQTHWNTPVLHGGHLYASSGRHTQGSTLRCVEWSTGKVKWSTDQWLDRQRDAGIPGAALVPERSILWREGGVSRASFTGIDDHLLCLGEYGELLVVKADPDAYRPAALIPPPTDADGDPLLRYPCWAAPVVSHGLLWVRGKSHLLCYELIP